MRILLTTDTVGGVWTFTRELSTELLCRGHQVALVSFGRSPSAAQVASCSEQARTFGRAFRYTASAAPLEWMPNNHEVLREDRDLLLRVAHSFLPDVFHSNQFCYGALDIHCPTLITAHSDVLSWAEACRPSGLENSAWLRRYETLVINGIRNANAIVAPTRWMSQALSRQYQDVPPVHTVLNGRQVTPYVRDRKLQAVSVGRLWDEAKNVGMLREVIAPFPILVAGEQQHQGSSAPTELGPAVSLGPLSELELVNLFSESSVYIATSVYEPFGLAPLEAALCGCAVLANDIPSLREVWGEAALYFHNATSLSSLLAHLRADAAALRHARERSAKRARRLTPARMADQYEMLYAELIATREDRTEIEGASFQELAAHVA